MIVKFDIFFEVSLMAEQDQITNWDVDYDIALVDEECRLLFAYAQKVVISILKREANPQKRRLILHEAARMPNRLEAREYSLIAECNSKVISMIHARESDKIKRTILIYDFETKLENIFTDVQMGGQVRENLKEKRENRQKQQGDALLQRMKKDNVYEMGELEGLLGDL